MHCFTAKEGSALDTREETQKDKSTCLALCSLTWEYQITLLNLILTQNQIWC